MRLLPTYLVICVHSVNLATLANTLLIWRLSWKTETLLNVPFQIVFSSLVCCQNLPLIKSRNHKSSTLGYFRLKLLAQHTLPVSVVEEDFVLDIKDTLPYDSNPEVEPEFQNERLFKINWYLCFSACKPFHMYQIQQ